MATCVLFVLSGAEKHSIKRSHKRPICQMNTGTASFELHNA